MGFIEKTFDLKEFAHALHKQPGIAGQKLDSDTLTPDDLIPSLRDVYYQILRDDMVDITGLDFGVIGEGDIENLENALCYSPAHDLFALSAIFRQFAPSAAAGCQFI